jgi:hypothetical protein
MGAFACTRYAKGVIPSAAVVRRDAASELVASFIRLHLSDLLPPFNLGSLFLARVFRFGSHFPRFIVEVIQRPIAAALSRDLSSYSLALQSNTRWVICGPVDPNRGSSARKRDDSSHRVGPHH